jgi:antitoxin (DNA-binding transcriptional repressor) of toxin-antitoxin stability system
MMRQVTIHHAKTQLSRLIEAAMAGEEIVIAKGDTPMVRRAPHWVRDQTSWRRQQRRISPPGKASQDAVRRPMRDRRPARQAGTDLEFVFRQPAVTRRADRECAGRTGAGQPDPLF